MSSTKGNEPNPIFTKYEHHPISKILLEAHERLGEQELCLLDLKLTTFEDQVLPGMVYSIQGYVVGGCPREVTACVSVPKTWWDHLKRDVLRKWTANPLTPIGYWFRDWASQIDMVTIVKREQVMSKICPHGLTDFPGMHSEFLTADVSNLRAEQW